MARDQVQVKFRKTVPDQPVLVRLQCESSELEMVQESWGGTHCLPREILRERLLSQIMSPLR